MISCSIVRLVECFPQVRKIVTGLALKVDGLYCHSSSLPLTTTMVNSKNPNKLIKNPTLPPGIQDSSKGIGESPDSLNLLSRTSSRAGKRVHSRGRPQTRRIARRSSKSVSASSASRNPSPEALSSSSSGESEEESVGSDPKTPTAPRVTTGKLSFKKLPPLKLPAASPEGKASTMSWDDQVAAEEGSSLVSGVLVVILMCESSFFSFETLMESTSAIVPAYC